MTVDACGSYYWFSWLACISTRFAGFAGNATKQERLRLANCCAVTKSLHVYHPSFMFRSKQDPILIQSSMPNCVDINKICVWWTDCLPSSWSSIHSKWCHADVAHMKVAAFTWCAGKNEWRASQSTQQCASVAKHAIHWHGRNTLFLSKISQSGGICCWRFSIISRTCTPDTEAGWLSSDTIISIICHDQPFEIIDHCEFHS